MKMKENVLLVLLKTKKYWKLNVLWKKILVNTKLSSNNLRDHLMDSIQLQNTLEEEYSTK